MNTEVKSPAWHKEVLKETEAGFAVGEEQATGGKPGQIYFLPTGKTGTDLFFTNETLRLLRPTGFTEI
jgi:hypothetical protein